MRKDVLNKSYTETLAEFAAGVVFDDLPQETVNATKRLVLDTIGCAVGGYSSNLGKIVTQVKSGLGGNPESTILGLGKKTSCASAAYINAELANAMDADDTSLKGHHANSVVLPALAVAERAGATGKQLITAVAVGFDVAIRVAYYMGSLVRPTSDGKVEYSMTAGLPWAVFGSVVSAGSLLKLDGQTMANAMGIAGYSTPVPSTSKSGLSPTPRPMTKYAFYGPMAEAGVMAALLAENGFTGDRTVLDSDRGFWRMAGGLESNFDALTDKLGQRWFIRETSFKPYPCCRYIHAPIDMLYAILKENNLQPDDIDEIDVGMITVAKLQRYDNIVIMNEVDTQTSVPYMLGVAALGIDPGPEWQNPARWQDPRVMAIARKIKIHADPESDAIYAKQLMTGTGERKKIHSKIEVKAKGKTFKAQADYAKGDPWQPEYVFTDAELKNKFRNFCYRTMRPENIENAITSAYDLENLTRIDQFTRCLG